MIDPVAPDAPGSIGIGFDRALHRNCSAVLWDNLDRNPDKLAVTGPAGDLTYRALCARAAKWGNAFRSAGLAPGSRIAFFLDDTPAYPAAFFGAVRAGYVPVLLNIQTRSELLNYFLVDSDAPLAVCEASLASSFSANVLQGTKVERVVIVNGTDAASGAVPESAFVDGEPDVLAAADTGPEDMAFWMYSSGSTGRPKGIVHLHHDMAYTHQSYGSHVLRLGADDRCFSAPKIFFAYGFGNSLTFPFSAGATTVLMPGRPEADAVLDVVERFRPTVLFGLPTLYTALCHAERVQDRDLSSLRLSISAAEVLSEEVYSGWKALTGYGPTEGLGSTEMLHIYLSNRLDDHRLGAAGAPVPGYEVKLVTPEGRVARPGEAGVMHVRGDSSAPCYWRKPEKTRETMRGDWIDTGDRFVERDGYYYFQGRADELIRVSGQWVWPLEVEHCLNEHPDVHECAVLAHELPDRRMTLRAVVRLREAAHADDATRARLQQYVKDRLLPHKYPRIVEFVADLPKTGTGKIDRQALRSAASTRAGASYRLGCDVGGTFTDFVLYEERSGAIHVEKCLTTPADPSVAILEGLRAFGSIDPEHVARTRRIAHATTLVANAVIERKGACTALLATRGFRDVLELRRHVRVTTYELWADPPAPLVPRHLRIPIGERIWSDGTVLRPVPPEEIEAAVALMRTEGVGSVAIAFLHSYVNPENEREAARLVRELAPEIAVTTSAEVLPQIKEYERTSTTVVNAYVKPLVRHYLGNLDTGLARTGYAAPLRVMLSNGGLGSTETAADFPLRLIESGPVAGAIVGRQIAQALALPEALSFDMGGTTAKACLIRDEAMPITDELEVARSRRFTRSSGFPVAVPAVNMIEIGAGGGSIAGINAMGLVQVGPESAGADPGPICYGRGGTRPTVTDADLLLGYLDPDNFAGGSMRLDEGAARDGIDEHLARPRGQSVLEAAWTVHDVVNETMGAAVRMHVTERGGNPRQATLVAFGGAGPLHACHLAAKLRVGRVMVPLRAGVLSALGLLMAPPAYDIVRTHKVPLGELDAASTGALMEEMAESIAGLLGRLGTEGELRFTRGVDVGYIGQSYQVTVPMEGSVDRDAVWQRFAALYREKYGYFYDDVPAEIVNLRVLGELVGGELALEPLPVEPGAAAVATGNRPAWSARERCMRPFSVFDRERLRPGMTFEGPAIVEEASATTIVDEGGKVEVDAYGSLVVAVDPEETP